MVETVETTIEAKSVTTLWGIEEKTRDAIIEVVNSTIEVAKEVDFVLVDGSVWRCMFWSLVASRINPNRLIVKLVDRKIVDLR